MPHFCLSLSVFSLCFFSSLTAPAQDFEKVPLLGQYPVEQTREESAFVEPGLLITSQKQLVELWAKLKGGDQPKVNFKTSILIANVRDAADPNRPRFMARSKQGQLELMVLTTRIGFQRSDRTITTLLEISRKGLTSFKAYNPKTNKHVVSPIKPITK